MEDSPPSPPWPHLAPAWAHGQAASHGQAARREERSTWYQASFLLGGLADSCLRGKQGGLGEAR